MNKKQKSMLIRIIIASVFFVPLYLISEEIVDVDMPDPALIVLFLIPYITVGYDIIRKALLGIKNGQVFDENFLMMVATIGAIVLGEYGEGVAVMLLYQIGEFFQSYAVGKSRKAIFDLMETRPDHIELEHDDRLMEKSGSEKLITRIARVYTPVVCCAALVTAVVPPLFIMITGNGAENYAGTGAIWSDWILRACTFLVISCPCAIVISIPLCFSAAIGGACSKGIFVKGDSSLEKLSSEGISGVSTAVGTTDSDEKIEAADVVFMDDDPGKPAGAEKIAKKCMRIVTQNIVFVLGVKVGCLFLAASGIANMWLAMFADVGVMIIAVLNSIRCMLNRDF
ncbi:MAG: hypothetical protein IKF07_00595 [Eubacterium sp.]|nr:hypothetical protein [Eubacterium sp.]